MKSFYSGQESMHQSRRVRSHLKKKKFLEPLVSPRRDDSGAEELTQPRPFQIRRNVLPEEKISIGPGD